MKLFVLLLALIGAATTSAVHPAQLSKIVPMHELPLFREKYPQVIKSNGVELTGRIVGGDESKPGQFPYMVGLSLIVAEGTGFCGATLISNEFVMTAAHCIVMEYCQDYDVILGAHHIVDIFEPSQVRVSPIQCIIHENWDFPTVTNDIGVMRIPPIEFNDRIQPITLPSRSQQNNDFSGKIAVAAGWGRSSDGAVDYEEFLRFIEQPIITNTLCNETFVGVIQNTHICISGEGFRSGCGGDSGGTLSVVTDDEIIIQVGITSFGALDGCELGYPTAYTRVTAFLDWISAKTNITIRP